MEDDGTAKFQKTYAKSTEADPELVEQTRATAKGTVTEAAGTADDPDPRHGPPLRRPGVAPVRRGPLDGQPAWSCAWCCRTARWLVDDVELR